MSYCGEITISFTSCREMLPDPAVYAACLRESFDELQAAVPGPATGGPRRLRSTSRRPPSTRRRSA
jgi:hypothetical protein